MTACPHRPIARAPHGAPPLWRGGVARRALLIGFALGLGGGFAGGAAAQPHVHTQGRYTLRASVVASRDIAAVTARRHGIEPSDHRGVLNVTVLRHDGDLDTPVPAEVTAEAHTLLGVAATVRLQAVEAEGRVSYLGSFEHAPRAVLDFVVTAHPSGTDEVLHLRFRERMWPR